MRVVGLLARYPDKVIPDTVMASPVAFDAAAGAEEATAPALEVRDALAAVA